jgi:hypothetical protein
MLPNGQKYRMESYRIAACPLVLVALLVSVGTSSVTLAQNVPAAGPSVTIHMPHAEEFVLALDELVVEERPASERAPGQARAAAKAVSGTELQRQTGPTAVFSARANSGGELANLRSALETANPNSRVHLVLYPPGQPRSESGRVLLTSDVAVVLAEGANAEAALGEFAADARPIAAAPGAYVIPAADPFAALERAQVLRQRSGVSAAYPLTKRVFRPR